MECRSTLFYRMHASQKVFFTPASASTFRTAATLASRSPAVVDYAKSNFFVDKKAAGAKPPSHFMYGGMYGLGKLFVPQDRTEALADAIVKDFVVGTYSALTENKPLGAPMRLYIDFDFSFASLDDREAMWKDVEVIMQEEVSKFFPDVDPTDGMFDAVILASGAKRIGEFYKAGIHVVYQNLFVDVNMALYITSALICRLEDEHLYGDPVGAWAKRIDQCVYADEPPRGLRWAWQFKTKPCENCGDAVDAARRGCSMCWCGVAIDKTASMYAPVYFLRRGTDCVRDIVSGCTRERPSVEMLMAASIRAVERSEPSAGFVLYPGHPPLPKLSVKRNAEGGGKQVSLSLMGATPAGEQLLMTDPRFGAVADAIQAVHPMYASISIQKVVQKAKGYAVAVQGKGSCYCMNYGKDHNKQRVKFFITASGVTQYCHCRCDVVRPSGKMCKDYASDRFPLSRAVLGLLFPDAVAKARFVMSDSDVDVSKIESEVVATCMQSRLDPSLFTENIRNMTPGQREVVISNKFSKKRKQAP